MNPGYAPLPVTFVGSFLILVIEVGEERLVGNSNLGEGRVGFTTTSLCVRSALYLAQIGC